MRLSGVSGREEEEKLGHLRSQIELNEVLSGVKFQSVDWEVKRKGVALLVDSIKDDFVVFLLCLL